MIDHVPATIREPLREALVRREVKRVDDEPATPASVIIPLVAREGATWVWLTKRPENMKRHRGQVAFPGGKRDPGETQLDAALREVGEELGWAPSNIDVLGGLDDFVTTTGFVISPFVAWLKDDLGVRPNPSEIARAFCVPLGEFVSTEPKPHFWRGKGLTRIAPSYHVDGEIVWGATARMMMDLVKIVREVSRRHALAAKR